MKKTKIILLISLIIITTASFAQQIKPAVNQLEFGQNYTKEQIISKLGTPTSVINHPDDVYHNYVEYKYGVNIFATIEGQLAYISLRDSTFSVNGILKVGHHKSMVSKLGGKIYKDRIGYQNEYGVISWAPSDDYLNGYGGLYIYYDLQTNVITKIWFNLVLL